MLQKLKEYISKINSLLEYIGTRLNEEVDYIIEQSYMPAQVTNANMNFYPTANQNAEKGWYVEKWKSGKIVMKTFAYLRPNNITLNNYFSLSFPKGVLPSRAYNVFLQPDDNASVLNHYGAYGRTGNINATVDYFTIMMNTKSIYTVRWSVEVIWTPPASALVRGGGRSVKSLLSSLGRKVRFYEFSY